MLKSLGQPNYHTFRAPYWDWRLESQRGSGIGAEDLFTEDRLGENVLVNGLQLVRGPYGDWETICWMVKGDICDPRESTGPIVRCPLPDRCTSSNPDWPTNEHVNTVLNFDNFDAPPWIQAPPSVGFRNYLDLDFTADYDTCREDRMCVCEDGPPCVAEQGTTTTLRLHLSVGYCFL